MRVYPAGFLGPRGPPFFYFFGGATGASRALKNKNKGAKSKKKEKGKKQKSKKRKKKRKKKKKRIK
jgi:hypothetical protein